MKACRQGFWPGNAAKKSIQNEVTAVGDEGLSRAVEPQPDGALGAKFTRQTLDLETGRGQTETIDLDWQRKTAERLDQLRAVGDHHHAPARGGDDLLAQE